MIIMIVWITFIVLLLTKILFRINKGFGISYTSLILNLCSCVISFIFSRILVNSKITNSLGKSLTEVVVSKVGNLSVFEELSEFIGSIVIGISVFYISYFILSIIMFIIKHLFIYSKFEENSDKKDNFVLTKLGIIVTNLISVFLTFIVLVTPIGFLYNSISTIFLKENKNVPFVSKIYLDKLTEMPDNVNDVSTTNEVFYTLYTVNAINDLKEGSNYIPSIRVAISSKTHFLPTIIADVASTGANNWKNEKEFLNYKPSFPNGREGKLYKSVLGIIEKWNKQKVVQDINTTLDIYEQISNYGIDKIKEEDGILIALGEKEFTEKLFVNLYKNNDFCELIPVVIEYGLGSVFDYIGMDFDEESVSNIDISKFSENDVKREARLVSEMINITSDIKNMNQKIQNGEITVEDLQKIEQEISKLEGSKILGDIANELKFQIEKNLPDFEF